MNDSFKKIMIQKTLYLNIIIYISFCISKDIDSFNFNYNQKTSIEINKNYYYHSGSNSQKLIDSTIIDIFEYKIICSNKNLINIKINEQEWETTNTNKKIKKINENILISEPILIRGTPIISIKLIPWKINQNGFLSYLSKFNFNISIENDLMIQDINYIPNNVINKKTINKYQNLVLGTEYLILTTPEFLEAANDLGYIHSEEVEENDRLIVEIITTNLIADEYGTINSENIRQYLLDFINNDHNLNLKYILLLGDENHIPPYYYNNSPTDDYFTSNSTIILAPQIPTGRIPVSNLNDANSIINQIREYLLVNNPGSWKSKTILIADDQNHPEQEEFSHSTNSNILYEMISEDLNLTNLYGTDYNPVPSDGWYSHPDMTYDIITNINNGAAIVNYIGHGNATSLAHEKILDMDRDINLIQAENQAIWIVGTCSFGFYDNNNCMAEKMLIKNDGSIALITSTRSVYASTNIQYLTRIFNNVKEYINNTDHSNLRLGDLFFLSKESTNDYLFQLFGDPALKIILPKKSSIINIEQSSESFEIGQQNYISYNENIYNDFSMIINGPEKYNEIGYYLPGEIIFQGNLYNNPASFYIPIDITQCDTCKARVSIFSENTNDMNSFIDNQENFYITNTNFSNTTDDDGPKIYLWHNNNLINNSGLATTPFEITISLSDESGINLAGGLGHNLKYTINDDSYIANQFFNYVSEDSGYFNIDLSTFLNWPINLTIEAWDNLNNKSIQNYTLFNNENHKFTVEKIYNFPNPFKTDTYFTFFATNDSKVTITILTINGIQINRLTKTVFGSEFSSIFWDGKDKYNNEIPNGTYIYHLSATNSIGTKFETLQKLTKLK